MLMAARQVHEISADALQALRDYAWPGNIRQLEWAMERAVVLGESESIDLADLPPEILHFASSPATASPSAEPTAAPAPAVANGSGPIISEGSWEEHEKAKIMEALQRSNGNITRAAQLLGMTFRTLQYRLDKFGIKKA